MNSVLSNYTITLYTLKGNHVIHVIYCSKHENLSRTGANPERIPGLIGINWECSVKTLGYTHKLCIYNKK